MNLLIVALLSLLIPFLISLLFCRLVAIGSGKNAELFWIVFLLVLCLVTVVAGNMTGFWDWLDNL